MPVLIGLPENYATLTADEKLRELTGLQPGAPVDALVERFEAVLAERQKYRRMLQRHDLDPDAEE